MSEGLDAIESSTEDKAADHKFLTPLRMWWRVKGREVAIKEREGSWLLEAAKDAAATLTAGGRDNDVFKLAVTAEEAAPDSLAGAVVWAGLVADAAGQSWAAAGLGVPSSREGLGLVPAAWFWHWPWDAGKQLEQEQPFLAQEHRVHLADRPLQWQQRLEGEGEKTDRREAAVGQSALQLEMF